MVFDFILDFLLDWKIGRAPVLFLPSLPSFPFPEYLLLPLALVALFRNRVHIRDYESDIHETGMVGSWYVLVMCEKELLLWTLLLASNG